VALETRQEMPSTKLTKFPLEMKCTGAIGRDEFIERKRVKRLLGIASKQIYRIENHWSRWRDLHGLITSCESTNDFKIYHNNTGCKGEK
jgi:hypothetical protein